MNCNYIVRQVPKTDFQSPINSAILQVKNFIKIFPKVKHGWTVRYNESDVTTVEAAKEAHKDMLLWLSKYLKKN